MFGTEVVRQVHLHAAAAIANRIAEDNELGQVFVECSQAVVHPGPDGGEESVTDVPPRMELQLRTMVVIGRPHRTHDGDVVDTIADVRPPIANLNTTLSAFAIANLQGQYFPAETAGVNLRGGAAGSFRFGLLAAGST